MRHRGFRIGGLALLAQTNNPRWFILASWHHPQSITWRWILSIGRHEINARPHFYAYGRNLRHWGLSVGLGTALMFRIDRREIALHLLGGEISVKTQSNMWRRANAVD